MNPLLLLMLGTAKEGGDYRMKDSRPQEWWNAFVHTGRIEDYLRYRGGDIYTARTGSSPRRRAVADRDPRSA